MINNPEILFENHLKIFVLLKDKIIFENELEKQNIEYYCDVENQPLIGNEIRYFIRNNDRSKIDKIFVDNQIIAQTETIKISDYRDGKRVMKLYLIATGIAIGIMLLIIVIDHLSN